jgi:hypothetical protein
MEAKMEKHTFQNQVMSTQMQYHWFEGQEMPKPKKETRNNRDRFKRDAVFLHHKK